jgi:hypothetical protein
MMPSRHWCESDQRRMYLDIERSIVVGRFRGGGFEVEGEIVIKLRAWLRVHVLFVVKATET